MDDEAAYREWYVRFYSFKETEKRCTTLRAARGALFLAAGTVAERLKISTRAYLYLEKSDLNGSISRNNFNRCAQALGCEHFYQLKSKKPFSLQIWEVLVKAVSRPRTQSALAHRAEDKMFDPQFRRAQGWIKNNEAQSAYRARIHYKTSFYGQKNTTVFQRDEKRDEGEEISPRLP